MAGVYGNAYCTLAALSSKNSSEGCKITSNIQASLRSPYVEIGYKENAPRIRLFKHMPRTWMEEFDGKSAENAAETNSPLRTRAWVLQEKELSNCTIYFAKNQLLWENQTKKASSQIPWQEIKALKPSDTPRLMYVSTKGQIQGGSQSSWYDLVEDYTSRSLSFTGDKLVAFSGLAKMYSQARSQYLAGIWSKDLPTGLLWRVKCSQATRTENLAPSWSWASLMGAVTYDSLKMEPDKDYAHFEHPGEVYHGLKTLKVHATRMSLEDSNKPYGDVREGRLALSGARCIEVDCGGMKAIQFSHGGQALLRYKRPIGVFYPDIASEAASVKKAYCIALHSESVIGLEYHGFRLKQDLAMTDMVMGIVIAKLPKCREYRRIGMARWVDELIFDSVQPTTIELV
ncbi:hypothetical protein E8E13_004223 [Curvularia kusanoi]|uniref:Heterokaryon incompatibility domain-containing protein n=1 Tax=Curvularia kusanoi TaxID=90978 RepID=A0A9P4W4S6_CURKU|nr:hypothetical protein E8E13_004223 [Curvularia kusanoi]